MMPQIHLVTSGAAVFFFALALGLPLGESVLWTAVGAVATLAIDLDHFAIQLLIRERRPIIFDILSQPLRLLDVKRLEERLHYDGFGNLRLKAHLAETMVAAALIWHFVPPFSLAILVSLWAHILMDVVQTITDPGRR